MSSRPCYWKPKRTSTSVTKEYKIQNPSTNSDASFLVDPADVSFKTSVSPGVSFLNILKHS